MIYVSAGNFQFLAALQRHSFRQPHVAVSRQILPSPSEAWQTELGSCRPDGQTLVISTQEASYQLTAQGAGLDLDTVRIRTATQANEVEVLPKKTTALPNPPLESTCGKNLTARWIDLNYKQVHKALTKMVAKRFALSAKAGMAEDHIQEYLMVLIRRDGLASRIRDGKKIWMSSIRNWAWNQISSQIRDAGRRPLTRHYMQARTPAELAVKGKEVNVKPSPYTFKTGNQSKVRSADGTLFSHYSADYDSAPEECMEVVRAVLRKRKVVRTEIKADIWKRWAVEGLPARQIAEEKGITLGTTQNYLREVRSAIADSREDFIKALAC